jgi:hypothetical protein
VYQNNTLSEFIIATCRVGSRAVFGASYKPRVVDPLLVRARCYLLPRLNIVYDLHHHEQGYVRSSISYHRRLDPDGLYDVIRNVEELTRLLKGGASLLT